MFHLSHPGVQNSNIVYRLGFPHTIFNPLIEEAYHHLSLHPRGSVPHPQYRQQDEVTQLHTALLNDAVGQYYTILLTHPFPPEIHPPQVLPREYLRFLKNISYASHTDNSCQRRIQSARIMKELRPAVTPRRDPRSAIELPPQSPPRKSSGRTSCLTNGICASPHVRDFAKITTSSYMRMDGLCPEITAGVNAISARGDPDIKDRYRYRRSIDALPSRPHTHCKKPPVHPGLKAPTMTLTANHFILPCKKQERSLPTVSEIRALSAQGYKYFSTGPPPNGTRVHTAKLAGNGQLLNDNGTVRSRYKKAVRFGHPLLELSMKAGEPASVCDGNGMDRITVHTEPVFQAIRHLPFIGGTAPTPIQVAAVEHYELGRRCFEQGKADLRIAMGTVVKTENLFKCTISESEVVMKQAHMAMLDAQLIRARIQHDLSRVEAQLKVARRGVVEAGVMIL